MSLRLYPRSPSSPLPFPRFALAGGSVPMVLGRIKGSRKTASRNTTVPSWRYRDLQQELLQGSPSGFVRCVRFALGGRGGRLRHRLLPGCSKCGVPWIAVGAFRVGIVVRSNHRRRAVLDLSQSNCDSRAVLCGKQTASSRAGALQQLQSLLCSGGQAVDDASISIFQPGPAG